MRAASHLGSNACRHYSRYENVSDLPLYWNVVLSFSLEWTAKTETAWMTVQSARGMGTDLDPLPCFHLYDNFSLFVFLLFLVPAGSPSHDGEVTLYAPDTNQPSLPTPFNLRVYSCLYGLFKVCNLFHKFSWKLSALSLCSSGLISCLIGPFNYISLYACLPQTWYNPLSLSRMGGAAEVEIEFPSVENTELNGSPLTAWSRSVYSHTHYTYCQRFIPCLFAPFRSIHLHFFFFFFAKPLPSFSCVGCG